MHVKRFEDAKNPMKRPTIEVLRACACKGFEDHGPKNQWVGYSQFLPGGGAGPDSTPFEKVYVVLEGELTVIINGQETILRAMDSCTIWPSESREIINRGNHVCKMLVVLPYPNGVKT